MLITIAGQDRKFCEQLRDLLAEQNHRAVVAAIGGGLLERLKAPPQPQLMILVCPEQEEAAAQLLCRIRDDAQLRPLPILCVNPRGAGADGVAVLDAGADDFINRPFNAQIFLARVRTLLRRRIWSGDAPEEPLTFLESGALSLHLVSRQAFLSGVPMSLTRLEFDLLAFLMRHAEQVFKRQDLLEAVWNYPESVETRTLDKHVETLRRKLGVAAGAIQTVHGVGYRFAVVSGSPR